LPQEKWRPPSRVELARQGRKIQSFPDGSYSIAPSTFATVHQRSGIELLPYEFREFAVVTTTGEEADVD
jgi:hypothetical protein